VAVLVLCIACTILLFDVWNFATCLLLINIDFSPVAVLLCYTRVCLYCCLHDGFFAYGTCSYYLWNTV
jgi:hypothetical protein